MSPVHRSELKEYKNKTHQHKSSKDKTKKQQQPFLTHKVHSDAAFMLCLFLLYN